MTGGLVFSSAGRTSIRGLAIAGVVTVAIFLGATAVAARTGLNATRFGSTGVTNAVL